MSKGDFLSLNKKARHNDIKNFIDGASIDGEKNQLNPKEKRDFKSIRLGFNEYEYKLLEKASQDENLTLVAFIRTSWMKRAQEHK